MARQLNKMSLSEAFEIFGFESGCKVTEKIIIKRYRELSLLNHPDKGGNAKVFAKIAGAKEILIRELGTITSTTSDNKKSVGSIFVDWLKAVDVKGIKNPFTTYQRRNVRKK